MDIKETECHALFPGLRQILWKDFGKTGFLGRFSEYNSVYSEISIYRHIFTGYGFVSKW